MIDLKELRELVSRLFVHIIEKHKIGEIELSHDFYWDIHAEDMLKLDKSPEAVTGHFGDDWEMLQVYINDPSEPLVAYSLIEVSSLLKLLGWILTDRLSPDGG